MRSLFFFLACHNAVVFGEHIPGIENGAADALSRDNINRFYVQVPWAKRQHTTVPPAILEALVVQQPDWTAVSWTELLVTTL